MQKFTFAGCCLAGILFACSVSAQVTQRIEVTVAGTGATGFSGDGGRATAAVVDSPYDVCMDASRNIYFVDKANLRIRKITASKGIISTIAGGGSLTSDGVSAVNAAISPRFMTVDGMGNIYFTMANSIKKVNTATGIITTLAGSATAGYTGDSGPASAATLNNPMGITTDAANNVYVVDRGNNVIREIFASSGYIITIAGNGTSGYTGDGASALSATLNGPAVITVNSAGDVYFSDQNPSFPSYDNSVVRMINISTGNVSTVLGTPVSPVNIYNIPALEAILGTITGLCTDPVTHNVYCDEMSCSCRYLDLVRDSLYEVAGNFASQSYTDDINAFSANMNFPVGMCMDPSGNGTIYIADCGNNRIRKLVTLSEKPVFAFGESQSIDACATAPATIDSQLAVGTTDSGTTITWTLLSAPSYGTVTGLPASTSAVGVMYLNYPTGITYTPDASFSTPDAFTVVASDGSVSDTVTVYATSDCGFPTNLITVASAKANTSVYPNPVTDELTVSSTQSISDIVITNILGQQVYYGKDIAATQKTINTATFPTGIYLVKINGSENFKIEKL